MSFRGIWHWLIRQLADHRVAYMLHAMKSEGVQRTDDETEDEHNVDAIASIRT